LLNKIRMIRKDFMDRPSVEQLLDYEIFNLIIKEKFDECGFSFNSKIVKEKKLTIVTLKICITIIIEIIKQLL
jgi:hypothetical protein